jgi:hypothetical protein
MTEELYRQFSEPFSKSVEKTLKKGGASLTYIPISEVINRLNLTLGSGGWQTRIISVERDSIDPEFITAHVELIAEIGQVPVIKHGMGGSKIKRMKSGDIVDLGDDYKGAVSDAIKKAAQQLGIGLYLARDEEAIRLDEIAADPERQKIEEIWSNVLNHISSGGDSLKSHLGTFWADTYPDQAKPSGDSISLEQAEALLRECVKFKLDGVTDE